MKSKIFRIQNNKNKKTIHLNISDTQNLTLASAHDSSTTSHILLPFRSLQLHTHFIIAAPLSSPCPSTHSISSSCAPLASLQFTSPNNHMSCSPSSTVRCSTMIWPSRCAGPLPARASWCNWLPNWVSSDPLLLSMRKCLFASNLTKAVNINSINAALTNQLPSN